MKKKYLLSFALLLSIVFSGCGRNAEDPSAERPEINESSAEVVHWFHLSACDVGASVSL